MKSLIITITAAYAVIAGYFGIRYFTRQDLGFTPFSNSIRNLVENLLHTKITAACEAVGFRAGRDSVTRN